MKITDVPQDVIDRIKPLRYDRIVEKHEGPWDWEGDFRFGDPELMSIEGRDVLLPIQRDQHANITILRTIVSADGNVLTVFLKDTTFYKDSKMADFFAGFLAICEKLNGTEIYLATVYHEWFILKQDELG